MKIVSKQTSSKMCFVCGVDNPISLGAHFYNMEDGSVMTKLKFKECHQSFPQRVHGGLITTILDELSLRAYWVKEPKVLGVTMSMETKFRKPLPYDVEVIGKALVEKETSRLIVTKACLMDKEGTIYAEAIVNLMKMPMEKVTDINFDEDLCIAIDPENPVEI